MPAQQLDIVKLRYTISIAIFLTNLAIGFSQDSKNLVSVKVLDSNAVDSSFLNYLLKNIICDSFTFVLQKNRSLFYEKSLRLGNIELYSGQLTGTTHLPPVKFLIEGDKITPYYNLNDKLLFFELLKSKLYQFPLLMFKKFNIEEFLFTQESKLIAGKVCDKGYSLGPDGDTTIVWMQKGSDESKISTVFNLYFTKPPPSPIMEFSIRNFRMGDSILEELTYSIYNAEIGDFSKEFNDLKNYKRVSEAEINAEMDTIRRKLIEVPNIKN